MSERFVRNTFESMRVLCLAVCLGCAGPRPRAHGPFIVHDQPSPAAAQPDATLPITDGKPCHESAAEGASSSPPATQVPLPTSGVQDAASPSCAFHTSLDSNITATSWNTDESIATGPGAFAEASRSISESLPAPATLNFRRSLSLRDAIDTALIQNPDAVIARAAGPVSGAARDVAVTYPWNPSVQVEVDPYARDAAGDFLLTRNTVSLTQTFEVRHQTRYRRRAADAGWSRERAIIAQGELTAAVAAVKAYFDVLYRKGLRDLAKDSAAIQARMVGVVDRRFAANLATPVERITASVAARQSQRQAELAEADYQVALNALRVVLNLSPEDPVEPEGGLESYQWLPATTALEQASAGGDSLCDDDTAVAASAWISHRPDVVAARFAVSAANANLDLARANLVPNIATGPVYERDENGTVFWGVLAQMDLPVLNTGRPLVRQRSAELQQQLITWKQTRARAVLQAQAAVNRYRIAHQLWSEKWATRDAGDNEMATVADAFEKGQASIVEVLSTQGSLIQERQNYLVLLNEISQAAADLIAALAIDPECLVEFP